MLQDCIFTPTLTGNLHLLSLTQLAYKGFKVECLHTKCTISKNDVVYATGTATPSGYILDEKQPSEFAFLSGTSNVNTKAIWHKRLAHLGEDNMLKMKDMVTGMESGAPKPMTISNTCPACVCSSHTRHISHEPVILPQRILEIIYVDICGPMPHKDLTGIRNFASYTDAKTPFTRTYGLREKSDNLAAFNTFMICAGCETGCYIISLHFDNTGENLSNELRSFCQSTGIIIRTTQPYSPEMNGVPERLNRTLVKETSTWLWDANLPIEFWREAIATATFVRNRCPTSKLAITPYEAYYSRKPNVGNSLKSSIAMSYNARNKPKSSSVPPTPKFKHTSHCSSIGVRGLRALYGMAIEDFKELWIIDSAASNHFMASRENMRKFIPISPVKVMTGNGII